MASPKIPTHKKTKFPPLVNVKVLEIEDALFSPESPVLLPGIKKTAPVGPPQIVLTGIEKLALIIKQFEFAPDVRMVISGHTDSSEPSSVQGAQWHFDLSKKRAENVKMLVDGEKDVWAAHSAVNHVAADRTVIKDIVTTLPEIAAAAVDADWRKEDLWKKIYDWYETELAKLLRLTDVQLILKQHLDPMFFEPDNTLFAPGKTPEFVGCGDSIPIKNSEKTNSND